ncbi:MAG: hypothetical protein ACK5G9_11285, partial [Akkermansiaceae bacterium]
IIGNPVFGQKGTAYFLKSNFVMMLLVGFDVFSNYWNIEFTHGKCIIGSLPSKFSKYLVCVLSHLEEVSFTCPIT